LHIFPVDDGVRIKPFFAEPFGKDNMFCVKLIQAHFVKVIRLSVQPVADIHHTNFVVINNLFRIIICFFQPIPSTILDIFPSFVQHPSTSQLGLDFVFGSAVKYRSDGTETQFFSCPSQMNFQYLSDVHTSGNTQRIEDNIDRRAVFQIRHIFDRNHSRNNAFVSVTSRHFIARG